MTLEETRKQKILYWTLWSEFIFIVPHMFDYKIGFWFLIYILTIYLLRDLGE